MREIEAFILDRVCLGFFMSAIFFYFIRKEVLCKSLKAQ